MSGIVGVVHVGGAPVDEALLHRLTDALAFRGPEGNRAWVSGQVGFGHTLMRVFDDVEEDRQPCTVGGDVWITADARIDDQATLLAMLARGGRAVPKGTTDAQLILHAYHVWGEDCVTHLLGDYAFAIWDGPRRRLYCARDPFGVKLFYYAKLGDVFVFSNTLDVVRQHPRVGDELNERAIGDFLLVGCNAELDTTFFADVQRVPPANWMVLDASSGALTQRRYWNFPVPEPLRYRRDEEYTEHFRELLRTAISDRLRTKSVGFYFSGGLDSTTVAAMTKEVFEQRGEAPRMFGVCRIGDSARPDNEGYFASIAADRIGMPVRLVALEGARYFDGSCDPRLRRPEPTDDPEIACSTELTRMLAESNRVSFLGEDGDALFSPASLISQAQFGALRKLALATMKYVARRRRLPFVGSFLRRRLTWPLKLPAASYPQWLTPEFESRNALRERLTAITAARPYSAHPIRPLACRFYTSLAWQPLLESLDAGVTGFLHDVRLPLIDVRMVGFAFAIPSIPWCERKEIIRQGMRERLPLEVLERPKTPGIGFEPADLHEMLSVARGSIKLAGELEKYVLLPRWEQAPVPTSAPIAWQDFLPLHLSNWIHNGRSIGRTSPIIEVNSND